MIIKNLEKIYLLRTAVRAKLFPDLKLRDFFAVLYNANPLISSKVIFFPVTGLIPSFCCQNLQHKDHYLC